MKTPLTITGHSTALFTTWYFVHQHGLLFDCGDGVTASLMQKARKVKHVFVSHADRDHLAGLLQFNQLNARSGLKIYYPKDCGSFSAMAEFSARFDPHVRGTQWIPLDRNQEVRINSDLVVRAVENRHVKTVGDEVKSFSFFVDSVRRKLRPEYVGRSGSEIAKAREEQGDSAITTEARSTILCYSADTPIESDGRYDAAEVLIHEATFLTEDEIEPDNPKRNKHSSLDQVMRVVVGSNIQHLVLGHFSSRYSTEQIEAAVQMEVERNRIAIPISLILPGQTVRDILQTEFCPSGHG